MNCSTPGLPVHHQLPEFTQTHVHWVSDALQLHEMLLVWIFTISSEKPSDRKILHQIVSFTIGEKTILTKKENILVIPNPSKQLSTRDNFLPRIWEEAAWNFHIPPDTLPGLRALGDFFFLNFLSRSSLKGCIPMGSFEDCFSLFLCTDHWGKLSCLSLLFFGTLHSDGVSFLFSFAFSFSSFLSYL